MTLRTIFILCGLFASNLAMAQVKPKITEVKEYEVFDGTRTLIIQEKKNGILDRDINVLIKNSSSTTTLYTQDIAGGFIIAVQVADIDQDNNNEIYYVTTSSGSGAYKSLYGISFEDDGEMLSFKLESSGQQEPYLEGHRGNDSFEFSSNTILRTFTLYNDDDANCCPTGGNRTIVYKLNKTNKIYSLEVDSYYGNKVAYPIKSNPFP